jgi:mono/diheme cytochrome c family protein
MDANRISKQERRENPDPGEQAMAIPTVIYMLAAFMVVFGIFYIVGVDLSLPSELGDQRTANDLMPKAVAAKSGGAESATADGAAVFAARCAACHQASGAGLPGVFPPLAGSEWVAGKGDLVAKIMLHGVQGAITVKGATFNGAMPPFKDQLSDAEIAAVASHVRSQWGNKAPPITADIVAKARTETASRTAPWNGDAELAALK